MGSFLLIRKDELRSVEIFFARWGAITVFFGRLLPVIRTFIAVPAGLARMPQGKFQIYTFVGSWLWCYALAYIGAKLESAGIAIQLYEPCSTSSTSGF